MRELKEGIAQNLHPHYVHGQLFDDRTTAQVEESRNMHNRKPFRNKEERKRARKIAFVEDGRYRSAAFVRFHPKPRKGDLS